ncbi:type IV secretory pathway VirB10-like protein [Nocardioides massiliensis]|uniref:Type IV secretory pathway VirB10-like protein n=2 Tax=Nocardioides massiliensis TaxID=1325935 RepID=A0ABT9NRA5_9ACTN|nr:type IV secretory pathway VirB10-like protein [Nocardioides massiliensis]
MSLPAADDLFRPTAEPPQPPPAEAARPAAEPAPAPVEPAPAEPAEQARRRPSGRVRHDEKMTVYMTAAELVELEQTRLRLRAEHSLAVDRGRLVRAAIAIALADLDEHGEDSQLMRRLRETGA